MAEGGGVELEEKRNGVAVREAGESVRLSILPTAILSCLNEVSSEPRTEPHNV